MRELVLLMAAALALGCYFSGGEDPPDHAGPTPGWHEEAWPARPAAPAAPAAGDAEVAGMTTCSGEWCRDPGAVESGDDPPPR